MPPSTQQKLLGEQFSQLTGSSERTAHRYLRHHHYQLNAAIDAFFASSDAASAQANSLEQRLNGHFDSLKKDPQEDGKDALAVNSTLEYFQNDLGVNIENAELLVAMEIVQAPGVGTITRKEYVAGWTAVGLSPSMHAQHVRAQIGLLKSDPVLFKKVYRHTFIAGKEPAQKALALDTALVYWDLLFSPPGRPWKSASYDWLSLWKHFLQEKWTRSVNKDMWNQTLEFANKTLQADGVDFWTEDAAWPSVIDEFVAWFKANSAGASKTGDLEMDSS